MTSPDGAFEVASIRSVQGGNSDEKDSLGAEDCLLKMQEPSRCDVVVAACSSARGHTVYVLVTMSPSKMLLIAGGLIIWRPNYPYCTSLTNKQVPML